MCVVFFMRQSKYPFGAVEVFNEIGYLRPIRFSFKFEARLFFKWISLQVLFYYDKNSCWFGLCAVVLIASSSSFYILSTTIFMLYQNINAICRMSVQFDTLGIHFISKNIWSKSNMFIWCKYDYSLIQSTGPLCCENKNGFRLFLIYPNRRAIAVHYINRRFVTRLSC